MCILEQTAGINSIWRIVRDKLAARSGHSVRTSKEKPPTKRAAQRLENNLKARRATLARLFRGLGSKRESARAPSV
jgi:hypothetical protein